MPRDPIAKLQLGNTRPDGEHHGPWPQELHSLTPRLEAVRAKILADRAGIPAAAFIDFPQRLQTEYHASRKCSQLGRIMHSAQRLAALVDRVIVIGSGGGQLGVRAITEACCHPFHNELSRGQRGGHPRLYFAGDDLDNDRTQGLLDVLHTHGPARDLTERWGLILIDRSGRNLETALACQQFLAALRQSCGGDEQLLAQLVIPIIGADRGNALGFSCAETYPLPDDVPLRYSILTAAGLLPAALLGLDTVKLVEGGCETLARFRDEPLDHGAHEASCVPQDNPVLWLGGAAHLLSSQQPSAPRLFCTWQPALEATGLWYEALLAETMTSGAEDHHWPLHALTAVYPRDALTRLPQPPAWALHLDVLQTRQDRLRASPLRQQPAFHVLDDKTWPDVLAAASSGMQDAQRLRRVASLSLTLPRLDEASLGQLWQMLMLTTAVEAELHGLDPYRPSVFPEHTRGFYRRLRIGPEAGNPTSGEPAENRDND